MPFQKGGAPISKKGRGRKIRSERTDKEGEGGRRFQTAIKGDSSSLHREKGD